MSKLTLPFYREFFEILESNEILNWRANDFVQAIFEKRKNMGDQDRQLIYRGLVILVECKYLKREKKPRTIGYTDIVRPYDLRYIRKISSRRK